MSTHDPYRPTPENFGRPARFGAPVDGAPAERLGARAGALPRQSGRVVHATFLQRVGAFLLDLLAFAPHVLGFVTGTTAYGFDRSGSYTSRPTSGGALAFGVGALATLVLWAWNRWVLAGRTGQSWGKKVMGLTLQRDGTGGPIGVGAAFVRDLALCVSVLHLVTLLPLWRRLWDRPQTFSDSLTRSVVLRRPR